MSFATFVYGSARVWVGQQAGFHVAAFDPELFAPVPLTQVEMTIKAGGQSVRCDSAGASINCPIPDVVPGPLTAHITVNTAAGSERFAMSLDAVAAPSAPPLAIRDARDALVPAKREVALPIRLYPSSGALISGVENTIDGWLTTPPPEGVAEIVLQHPRTELSLQGALFSFSIYPADLPRAVVLELGTTTYEIPLQARPTQSAVTLHDRPEGVAAQVATVPNRDPVYLDVWLDDVLYHAASQPALTRHRQFLVSLPAYTGLIRFETFRNLLASEGSAARAYLWTGATENELFALLRNLPGSDPIFDLVKRTPAPTAQMARMALSRVFPNQPGCPLVYSTLEARRHDVAQKDVLRGHVHRLFVLTGVLGILGLVAWGLRHHVRTTRALVFVHQDAIAAGEDVVPLQRAPWLGLATDLALIAVALGFGGYLFYVVLTQMQWK